MNRSPFDSAFSQLPTIIIDKKNATIHPLDSLSKNRDRRDINDSLIIFTIDIMEVYEGEYSNGTSAYGIRGIVSRLFRDGKLKTTRLIDSKSFYDSAPESITVRCQALDAMAVIIRDILITRLNHIFRVLLNKNK
jgi:hypothetical protein